MLVSIMNQVACLAHLVRIVRDQASLLLQVIAQLDISVEAVALWQLHSRVARALIV